jgi:hypothetical protein
LPALSPQILKSKMEKSTTASGHEQSLHNETTVTTGNPLLDNGDNIQLDGLPDNSFSVSPTSAITPSNSGSEHALGINDLISGHATSNIGGGYLQFAVQNGAVTLSLDISNPNETGNHTNISLATIEGVAGLSNTEILNALLANHEIKFG